MEAPLDLKEIKVSGYKTLRSLCLPLRRMNVLIGANGAGKSNLVSLFSLLNWMTRGRRLQEYIAVNGGAHSLLHLGPEMTPQIGLGLRFQTASGENEYEARLFYAATDTLIFAEEKLRYSKTGFGTKALWIDLGAGHRESGMLGPQVSESQQKSIETILGFMNRCVVYQFHNTSRTSRIKQKWSVNDGRYLKSDAGNLAPFLLRLRAAHKIEYRRIVETLRQVAPFFDDFVLDAEQNQILLRWQELGSDLVFDAHQGSDGLLRVMALVSLLLQPEQDLPSVLIIDEPELGLHPFALQIVGGLLKSASKRAQVIVATQSTGLLNEFEPDDVIVVERKGFESRFSRLDSDTLRDWLDNYSLPELWEKNVLGGRPTK